MPLSLAAAACGGPQPAEQAAKDPVPAAPAAMPTGTPPAPAKPASRAPVADAPLGEASAQGAAEVLQTYYALIEAGDYDRAWRLREPGRATAAQLAASFEDYAEHHANVGAPSEIAGAAGSLYVEVPVQLYGRMKNGKPFSSAGTVTLRRSNDVPGTTPEQRRWRIYSG